MEQSLRYTGVDRFTVLSPEPGTLWRNTCKVELIYDYLSSNSCPTEYLLYADSDDALLRASPEQAIKQIQKRRCELLFSNTKFVGYTYGFMKDRREWAEATAREADHARIYLNAGVFIARPHFLKRVIERVLEFVGDEPFSKAELIARWTEERRNQSESTFPHGIGSDQTILRYLHPDFFPEMQIDYESVLAPR